MTLKNTKKWMGFTAVFAVVFMISCTDSTTLDQELLSVTDVQDIVLLDDIAADIDAILDQDELDDPFSSKYSETSKLLTCPERTVDAGQNYRTVTLDFGDGCVRDNGMEFSGVIVLAYTRSATGASKTVTFENFFVNGHAIEGSRTIVYVRENANGNHQSTITIAMTITFVNGDVISRNGEKIREQIAGSNTPHVRGDDVHSIRGSWETVARNGVVRTATITTDLRREFACRYLVSGVLELSRGDATGTLDFGDGTCDNLGTFTNANGETREIVLRE